MADILLSFGLLTNTAAVAKIQDDLNGIIDKINKNPPQVMVGLKADPGSIATFRKEIEGIITKMGLSSEGTNKKDSGVKQLKKDTVEYYNSLERVRNQIVKLRKAENNWSAAGGGFTDAQYTQLKRAIKDLEDLEMELMTGFMDPKDFEYKFSYLKSKFAELHMYIQAFGEDHKFEIISGDEINDAKAKISSAISYIKKLRKEYEGIKTVKDPLGVADIDVHSFLDEQETALRDLEKSLGATLTKTDLNKVLTRVRGELKRVSSEAAITPEVLFGKAYDKAEKRAYSYYRTIRNYADNTYQNIEIQDPFGDPSNIISASDALDECAYEVYGLINQLESAPLSANEFDSAMARIEARVEKVRAAASVNGSDISSKKTLEKDSKEWLEAQKRLDNQLVAMRKSREKWTGASSGASSGFYNEISAQITVLENLKQKLNEGKLTAEEFYDTFNRATSKYSDSKENINRLGEDYKSDEWLEAQKRLDSLLVTMRKSREMWTEASGGASSGFYNEISTQIDVLENLKQKLNEGKLTIEEFYSTLNSAALKYSNSKENINRLGEDHKSEVLIGENVTKQLDKIKQIDDLIASTQKKISEWTAAKGGKTSSSYQNLQSQIEDLQILKSLVLDGTEPVSYVERVFREIRNIINDESIKIKEAGENIGAPEILTGDDANDAIAKLEAQFKRALSLKDKYGSLGDVTDPLTDKTFDASDSINGQIGAIKSLVADIKAGKIKSDEFAQSLQRITSALGQIERASADHKILTGDDANDAIAKLEAQFKKALFLKEKYGSLGDMVDPLTGKTFNVEGLITSQIDTIKGLATDIEAGKIKADEFAQSLYKIISALGQIERASADHIVDGSIEQINMSEAAAKKASIIEKNLEKWNAAEKDPKTAGAYKKYGETAKKFTQLADQINESSISMSEAKRLAAEYIATMGECERTIAENGKAHQTLGSRIKSLASKFISWLSVSQVIMALYDAARRMVSTAIEVDTAMTELRKVTNETDSTYEKFLDNAANRAKEVGATLKDVVNATASFARLGYNIDEAANLADTAIVYKNVADDIESIDDASTSIISTMQAFGVEAGNAMSIVDKFNEVSNNFAITSGGLGEALQRSASAMNAAGNTLDETIALVTAANTTVQNPESVGTTLKTISMYLRAAKTEAEEAGESTDGMASSVSELREELLDLTGEKVDIQLDENTFKSTYQILKELAEVWDELTDVSQANILEMIGGKRNANVTSALIESFNLVEDILETSKGSAGSALAENEKYLESIEGHISKFKASFEALSETVINSDITKMVIDIGTFFLDAANSVFKLIDALGGLDSILKVVIGFKAAGFIGGLIDGKSPLSKFSKTIESLKKVEVLNPIISGIEGIFRSKNNISDYILSLKDISDIIKGGKLGEMANGDFFGGMDDMSRKITGVGTATLALRGLVVAITAVSAAYALYKQAEQERITSAKEDIELYKEQSSALNDYKSEVASLKNSLEYGNLSQEESYNARARLLEIQNEIIANYGAEAGALNLLAASADKASASIDDVTKGFAEQHLAENAKAIDEATKRMTKIRTYSSDGFTVSENAVLALKDAVSKFDNVSLSGDNLEGYFINITGDANEARDTISKLQDEFQTLHKQYALQGKDSGLDNAIAGLSAVYSDIQKYVADYEDIYDEAMKMKVASGYDKNVYGQDVTYNSILQDMTDAQLEYNDAVSGSFDSVQEQVKAYSAGIKAMEAMRGKLDSMIFTDPAVENYFYDMLEQWQSDMDKKQLFIDVVARFEGTGEESDKFDTAIDKAENLIGSKVFDAFKDENGLIDGFQVLDEALTVESLGDTTEGLTGAQLAVKELMDACTESGTDLESFLFTLSQAGIISSSLADSVNAVSSSVSGHATTLSSIKTEQSALTAALKEQGGTGTLTLETYNALIAESKDYADCLEYENGAMRINADAANTMLEAKMLTEALDLEGQIIKETAQYEENSKTLKKLTEQFKPYINGTEGMSDEEKEHAKSLEKQIKNLEDSQDAIRNTIQQYSMLRAELLNMNSAYSKWQAAQDAPETGEMYDNMKTALDQIKDGLKTGKTGTLKYQTAVEMLVNLEDPSPKQVQGYMKKLNRYITDNSSGAKNFINDMINKGLMESSTGGRATWNDAWLKDASMTIDEICEIMEITPTMAKAIFGELEEYHFDFSWDEDDFNNAILEKKLKELQDEVKKYKQALSDNPDIAPEIDSTTLDNYIAKITDATNKLKELNDKNASGKFDYDIKSLKEEIEGYLAEGITLGIDFEKIGMDEDFFSSLGLDVQTADVQAQLAAVAGDLDEIAAKITAIAAKSIGDLGAAAASNMLYAVYSRLESIESFTINDKEFNVKAILSGDGSSFVGGSDGGNAQARGTINAQGGRTLVGELGRELVVSGNRYYTVGDKGAEFVNLKRGDIVFNHIDTERILGMSSKTHQGQAFARGSTPAEVEAAAQAREQAQLDRAIAEALKTTAEREAEAHADEANEIAAIINSKNSANAIQDSSRAEDQAYKRDSGYGSLGVTPTPKPTPKPNPYPDGGATDLAGTGTGGPGSKGAKEAFEKQYKEHKHMLEMDEEEVSEYLDWLEGAYKGAFKENSEEYWKYQEEVYKGRQDLFKDMLGDKEHYISMLVADEEDASIIVSNYQELIKSVQAELDKAYESGLDDNDDYVQELKDKLVDYRDEIKTINDDITEDAKDSYEDLVEYRMDMLKQELENEKDALSERINTLQDFYDKQKDMLQDAYDEEEYLEEQADKRKVISDLEDELDMLEHDDSAYAQRRKLEIEEELAEAKEELAKFEEEHALEMAKDMLDKQYKLQEGALNSEIDKIDEKLEDQKGLRDQAVADLQNGDLELYEAMIAYNNIYGDGNTNTIKTMWEDAYVAMEKYFELYHKYYEGMQLQNVTGYVPLPVGQGYASGTYSATPGIHEIEEDGFEYIFESSNGRKYRMFRGKEKVLNAAATDFLYKFANSGGKILENMISGAKAPVPSSVVSNNKVFEIKTGDIVIQGNATERTVSEIRRAQRESVDFMLKELGRLQNR